MVARLRRSTTGYCLSPLAGLKFRLACARKLSNKHPLNFRFVEQFAIIFLCYLLYGLLLRPFLTRRMRRIIEVKDEEEASEDDAATQK